MTEFPEGHVFTRSADAKKAGWFSRRHKTNEAHLRARASRLEAQNDKLARAANGGTAKTFSDIDWDFTAGNGLTGLKECVKTGYLKIESALDGVRMQIEMSGSNSRLERLKRWLMNR